ncbi:MAG TPA: hypothetical protein VIR04_01585 [Paralcaligenes sp.]|jgi:hypothetical protein
MSWRFIIAILLIAGGASAWGGLRLGNWLVAHGPVAKEIPEQSRETAVPVLDANGRPYVAQPPQPLVDGRLAAPQKLAEVAWKIPDQSLNATMANAAIPVATTPITMVEAQRLASGGQNLVGIADVGNLGLAAGGHSNGPIQPIEVPDTTVRQAATHTPAKNQAWQARLRQDLQVCSAQGFFERPTCAWAARNKYCEANNAWGQTRDCPAKNF